LKQERHQIQAKYRSLKQAWPDGIVGIEQPGDEAKNVGAGQAPKSILYQKQNSRIKANKKRTENRYQNRLGVVVR